VSEINTYGCRVGYRSKNTIRLLGHEGVERIGVWGGDVPLPTDGGVWEGALPLPRKFFDFWAQKGEFWCILGLIKPTVDRPGYPGVSIVLAISRLGRGDRPLALPTDSPLGSGLEVR